MKRKTCEFEHLSLLNFDLLFNSIGITHIIHLSNLFSVRRSVLHYQSSHYYHNPIVAEYLGIFTSPSRTVKSI
jgi:hypothetical protein